MSLQAFFCAKLWWCSTGHERTRRQGRFHHNLRGSLPQIMLIWVFRGNCSGIPCMTSALIMVTSTEKELYTTRHTRWHKQAFSHILTSIPLSVTTIIINVCGEKERWHWYAGMRIFFFYTLVYLKKRSDADKDCIEFLIKPGWKCTPWSVRKNFNFFPRIDWRLIVWYSQISHSIEEKCVKYHTFRR